MPRRLVFRAVAAGLAAILSLAAMPAGAEPVIFPAVESDVPRLSGELRLPAGAGPFPAVVLLHGCTGPWLPWGELWSGRLVRWGYAALRVDSFGPRGHPDGICRQQPFPFTPHQTSGDAHAARAWLAALPQVDAGRIAVLGMSFGGEAALYAVQNSYLSDRLRPSPFRAAIALYPWCPPRLFRLDAPLLVLAGAADDWTPSAFCERMAVEDPAGGALTLHVYPGATHVFDVDQPDHTYLGHRIRHHPAAARDAARRVRRFLDRHLRVRGPLRRE